MKMKINFNVKLEDRQQEMVDVIELAGNITLFSLVQMMGDVRVYPTLKQLLELGVVIGKPKPGAMTSYSIAGSEVVETAESPRAKASLPVDTGDIDDWMGTLFDEFGKQDKKMTLNTAGKLLGLSKKKVLELFEQMMEEGRIEKLAKGGKYMGHPFDYYKFP